MFLSAVRQGFVACVYVCVSSWLKTNSGEPLGPQLYLLHRLVKCNMEIFGRRRGENHMKGNL